MPSKHKTAGMRTRHTRLVTDKTPPLRIEEIRRALGLTQTQAASRAGMGQSDWHKWEKGKSGKDVPRLRQIAELGLKVKVGELFDVPPKGEYTSQQQRAAKVAASLDGDDLREWLAMGEHLAKRPPAEPLITTARKQTRPKPQSESPSRDGRRRSVAK